MAELHPIASDQNIDNKSSNTITTNGLSECIDDKSFDALSIKDIDEEIKDKQIFKTTNPNIQIIQKPRYIDDPGLSLNYELLLTPLNLAEDCWKIIYRNMDNGVEYRRFACETDLDPIIELITKDLSEPYSIYTYRYFIYNWPNLCILAWLEGVCVGAIVGKIDSPYEIGLGKPTRGYIAMLAVRDGYRRLKIGSRLVQLVIDGMIEKGCREVVLETEITNTAALALYEKLGFLRDKRLFRYYLNGVDAFRLKLWIPE